MSRKVLKATNNTHNWQRNPCTDCKSAELCTTRGIPYHSAKLHPGPCNKCGHAATDRQTDTRTRVTTIHFASSTTHAKCNKSMQIFKKQEGEFKPTSCCGFQHGNDIRTIFLVRWIGRVHRAAVLREARQMYGVEGEVHDGGKKMA